jgi:hypothetical protein
MARLAQGVTRKGSRALQSKSNKSGVCFAARKRRERTMSQEIPNPYRLPFTADHYQWRGKPAALIPGRCGFVYEPTPRTMPWSELIANGKRISEQQFMSLLYAQE